MPNLYGLNLQEAQDALQIAGVLNTSALGYFGDWPISLQWTPPQAGVSFTADGSWSADSVLSADQVTPLFTPGTVVNQSIVAGAAVAANAAVMLTLIQYPMGVSYS
jgi:hypothetical protein